MTAPDFDAAREAYETAQQELLALIDAPQTSGATANEYRAMLAEAQEASNNAHLAWMREAWG